MNQSRTRQALHSPSGFDAPDDVRLARCHACKGALEDVLEKVSHDVGARRFEAVLRAQRCASCGEVTFAGPALGRFEAAVARALVDAGAGDGAAVRWIRKAAGIRAVDLAELLGVTPETVSRWENDKHPIDRAAWAALAAIAVEGTDGVTAVRLRSAAAPKRLPKVVRLGSAA